MGVSGRCLIIVECRVALRSLSVATVGALTLAVAAVGLLMLAHLDASVNVEELEVLSLAAGFVVGDFEAASVGRSGVADVTVGNLLDLVGGEERVEGGV